MDIDNYKITICNKRYVLFTSVNEFFLFQLFGFVGNESIQG